MNIKSLPGIFSPAQVVKRTEAERRLKSDSSHERDADGRQPGEGGPERRRLSDEELAAALAYLKDLSAVKDNSWQVNVREQNDLRIVFIEDLRGKVIRRIPEHDLLLLLESREKNTGHLLNKAL